MKENEQRESYESILNYVATRSGISFRRTGNILKEFSKAVQFFIAEGYDVELDGLCTLSFEGKGTTIYRNPLRGLSHIVSYIEEATGFLPLDIKQVTLMYFKRIHFLLSIGQHVNVKGICYLRVQEGEEYTRCVARLSGVVKKPALHTFYVLTGTGQVTILPVPEKNLRIKVTLSEQIEVPSAKAVPQPLILKTLDI